MAIDNMMSAQALLRAQTHVYNVCAQGGELTLVRPVTKDELGAALAETTVLFKSFPTRYSPYDRETTEKISWAENTDILCFVSKKELDVNSFTVKGLKAKYSKMRYNNQTYDIRYIEYYSPFANDYLYMVVGGKA